jgi:hypothetical protein
LSLFKPRTALNRMNGAAQRRLCGLGPLMPFAFRHTRVNKSRACPEADPA